MAADGPETTAPYPGPLDHYSADADAPVDAGVYRVVGTDEESVTLLRVAEDGRRVNSGVVVQVPRTDLDALASTGNPDTGLGRLRQAPKTLAARPLLSGVALLFVAVGGYRVATASDDGGVAFLLGGAVVLWLLLR